MEIEIFDQVKVQLEDKIDYGYVVNICLEEPKYEVLLWKKAEDNSQAPFTKWIDECDFIEFLGGSFNDLDECEQFELESKLFDILEALKEKEYREASKGLGKGV